MENKIKRTFARQEAYLKLRDWILDGTLTPGSQLRDKDLGARLGVSRTPIREALLRLENEGFIATKPNSSTHVSKIDIQGALPLYSIVWTLERLALSQAFESIRDVHIQCMIEANERFLQKLKAQDRFATSELDCEFHSVYIKLSKNPELEKIISDIKTKLKRIDIYYFEKTKNELFSYDEHNQIIEAIRQKNLSCALEAIEKNWKNSLSRLGDRHVRK